MKTRRLTLLGRITCTALIAIMLLGITFTFNTVIGLNDVNSDTEQIFTEITVAAGDTIWDIAQSITDDGSDVRETVHYICQINDINASELYAGQTIKIPGDF